MGPSALRREAVADRGGIQTGSRACRHAGKQPRRGPEGRDPGAVRLHLQDEAKGWFSGAKVKFLPVFRALAGEITRWPGAEVAYKVGYGNVPHFNRLAKEAWGCTPTEARQADRSAGSGAAQP